nr:DUF4097 family beta strand repeat-containing protein [Streptomyces sp. SID5468]
MGFRAPLLATVLGLALAGCGHAVADRGPAEHRSFAFTGKRLTIETTEGSLVVEAADVRKVEVTRWFRGRAVLGVTPRATWDLTGATLALRTHCAGVVSSCSIRHKVLVPRGLAVAVRAGDGKVEAEDIGTPLNISTANGSVQVKDCSGDLTLTSHNGKVTATGTGARTVRARSGNGSVQLGFATVPDRVDVTSGNGKVTVELPPASYDVTARSSNGSTHVDVPVKRHSGHVVTVRVKNGSATVRTAT